MGLYTKQQHATCILFPTGRDLAWAREKDDCENS